MNVNSRWHGLALILGGLLLGLVTLFHPNDIADPSVVATTRWALVHGLSTLGSVIILLGLEGIQQRVTGVLSLVGHLLVFSSLALFTFVFAMEVFVIPVIASDPNAGALLDPAGPLFGGPLGLLLPITGLAYLLGAILLGIAILRTGTLPKASGILLIISSPVAFAPPLPFLVLPICALALGLALISAGFAIWSQPMSKIEMAMA